MKRAVVVLSLTVVTALAAAGCSDGDDGPSIVVYNAQHEQLLEELAPAFTKKTGIEVELRNGSDPELAAQLAQEGDASPADVFLTENSPAMSSVERAGLFAPLDQATLTPIPEQYRAASGLWTGFAARSTVLVYNTDQVQESDLPNSLMDLAGPEWKGRISFSPTGADFQAIVSAVLDLEGEDKTRAWLAGLKANGTVYDGNNVVLESVNSGESEIGIIYHYYWYRDQAESGDVSDNSALHFFGDQDPGAFVSVSGAGVLKSSDSPDDAQEFVAYLTSQEGQQALADSYALEYPLNPAVRLGSPVKPFAELDPPVVGVSDLDGEKVVELMTEAGFL
jgi:iron(III) transport system substrate-binding protein